MFHRIASALLEDLIFVQTRKRLEGLSMNIVRIIQKEVVQ